MISNVVTSIRSRKIWTTRGFIIRGGVAIAIILGALLTNRSFVGWGVFASFAILMVPIGRIRSFLFSFGPYAATWFIFTALRSASDETPLAKTLNLEAPDFERELFRGQLPSITLQDRLYDHQNLHWYDFATTAVHWSYFIVPHAVAIYLWYKHPAVFRRFLGAMIILLSMGLAIYFLLPSNPPWMAPEPCNSPSCPVVYRVMEKVGQDLGGGLYNASYKVIGESNPRAAMPSIHTAITILLIFPAFAVSRRWGLIMLAYGLAMGYSLMYMGEHYFIDVIAGAAIAAYGWYAFPMVAKLIEAARKPIARPIPAPAATNQSTGPPQESVPA
ncbi:MAG TPA: phosphatase PAP2 family protein [Thermomicrobiales bacterium]|nr:phosphatase PAP2 family protein [Thermomicrobiales bacterium]HRA46689.1 phosphatase PAP2 family protein [Thermomicrobiales bacterium]